MNRYKWLLGQVKRRYFNRIAPTDAVQFLHVPKTGGTYIAQLESTNKPVIWPLNYLGHVLIESQGTRPSHWPCNAYKTENIIKRNSLDKGPIFTIVRNPFDWLVSYIGFAAGWNKNHRNTNHVDFAIGQKGFDYTLKTILERDNQIWPNSSFLYFPFFDSNGKWLPDWVLRNETLDMDLRRFAKDLDLTYNQSSPQKVGNRKDYRFYYNTELVDLVEQSYERELRMFGYSFDGSLYNTSHVGEIKTDVKDLTIYNHFNDQLMFNGKLF